MSRWTVALSVAAVALGVVLVALPERTTPGPRYRFFQFNMCGNICNHGSKGTVLNSVRESILDFRPVAVSLNEVCRSQFRRIRARTGMRGRWIGTKHVDNDCDRNKYGIGVLVRPRIKATSVWRLSRAVNRERRKLLCVTTNLARHASVCTTHIITRDHRSLQVRQIKKVTRKVNSLATRHPVVLMGDFNLPPDANTLDRLYTGAHGRGAYGKFVEVDAGGCRCGESTHGNEKLDYVFISGRHWQRPWGDATYVSPRWISDHDPLRGTATLRSSSGTPRARNSFVIL